MLRLSRLLPVLLVSAALTGCSGGPLAPQASYPDRPEGSDKILYSDQKRETIWGAGETLGSKLFGSGDSAGAAADSTAGSAAAVISGIGVNSFLWRAALDTISFMPVASADPFGGVILTDWYENPKARNERFKINLYILDKQLRADGLRVSVFKQTKNKAGWSDADIADDMATSIENTVLTRARELRVAQLGLQED